MRLTWLVTLDPQSENREMSSGPQLAFSVVCKLLISLKDSMSPRGLLSLRLSPGKYRVVFPS